MPRCYPTSERMHWNSGFDLAFDNGASQSDSLTVDCGRKRHASNKCYGWLHAVKHVFSRQGAGARIGKQSEASIFLC